METDARRKTEQSLRRIADLGESMIRDQRSRADAFRRRSDAMLGFAGVMISLSPFLYSAIDGGAAVYLFGVGIAELASSVVASLLVTHPRNLTSPKVDGLTNLAEHILESAASGEQVNPDDIDRRWIEALFVGNNGYPGPVLAAKLAADLRGEVLRWQSAFWLAGVVALAAAILAITI